MGRDVAGDSQSGFRVGGRTLMIISLSLSLSLSLSPTTRSFFSRSVLQHYRHTMMCPNNALAAAAAAAASAAAGGVGVVASSTALTFRCYATNCVVDGFIVTTREAAW